MASPTTAGRRDHALLKGSQAINAGGLVPSCPGHDQRFVPRDLNPSDIGAYERFFCGRRLVNRVGTDAGERLRGTRRKDGIVGFAGRDVLIGLGKGTGSAVAPAATDCWAARVATDSSARGRATG